MSDWHVYILRCADGSFYTGIALDVARRLQEHESGVRGAKYLRGRAPLELVFEQVAGDRAAAQRLEHRVKRLSRIEKEALIGGDLSLLQAATFIEAIEQRQGLKISCPEEIAFKLGYIDADQVRDAAISLKQNEYGQYLLKMLADTVY